MTIWSEIVLLRPCQVCICSFALQILEIDETKKKKKSQYNLVVVVISLLHIQVYDELVAFVTLLHIVG